MIGHGMMGRWHSLTLQNETDCRLHSLVGRRAEPTEAFAEEFGYANAFTSLEDALAQPDIDVVVVASPSERHYGDALTALQRGHHVLVEIPMAMTLANAQNLVDAAAQVGRWLGVVYPMRMMPTMTQLRARLLGGKEQLRFINARFFIERWQNIGATGYQRSWTDNLVWHHLGHLVDFCLWLADTPVTRVETFMPDVDETTGTPMHAVITMETADKRSLIVHGTYAGHDAVCETLIMTDRDCYRVDVVRSELVTGGGSEPLQSEQDDCAAALRDFLDSVRDGRDPAISGCGVIKTMTVLDQVQSAWDQRFGTQSIPGRQLS